jgi:hypothetical protein
VSLKSQNSGTSFLGTNSPSGEKHTPQDFAEAIALAAQSVGLTPTVTLISQGLGTIEAEGGFDGSGWQGDGEHIGPWAEESSFGSRADRMDPWKSTVAAMKRYKADGGFNDGWWKWEGGEVEGTGQQRAHKYKAIAETALINIATAQPSGTPGIVEEAGNAISGAEDFLSEAFSFLTDFRKLGQLAAEGFAWFVRLIAKAIWDYVIAPVLHWTERAVSYYWVNYFGTGTEQGSGFGYTLRQNAGTITILFWATGYAILWSDGEGSTLVEPHESILGQGIKGIEGAIARRNLIKPKNVKKETPTKPKPKTSKVPIERQDTFSVSRKRPISVTGQHTEGRNRQHASRRGQFTPAPIQRPGQNRPAERKKLVVAQGYSRRAQNPPPQKSAKQSKPRMGT